MNFIMSIPNQKVQVWMKEDIKNLKICLEAPPMGARTLPGDFMITSPAD